MQSKSDTELLRDYAANNSEAVFRELMRRYAGFVYSAALRQMDNREAARDVTQMVFTDLARKAGSLHADTILIGWAFPGAPAAAPGPPRRGGPPPPNPPPDQHVPPQPTPPSPPPPNNT